MIKRVCFTGVEAPGAVSETLTYNDREYKIYRAIVDGELTDLKIYKGLDLRGMPGWAMWPGVYLCEFDDDGFVVNTTVDDDIQMGYYVEAPQNGKITLGHMREQYEFEPGAPLWLFGKGFIPEEFKKTIEAAESGWDDNWFIRTENGKIAEMWVSHAPGLGSGAIVEEIRKFNSDWGPAAENGLALEYNYFEPKLEAGKTYPIFVWFHGLHSGTGTWTNQFEFNPIANWAKDEFQQRFREGGAYILTPRANEDLRPGHGISWNEDHVEPFFAMIDDFVKKHPFADRNRLFIGGFSMGGYMSWMCIARHPELLGGAFPCCGLITPSPEDIERSKKLPVFHIHGDGDGDYTDRVIETMKPYLESNPLSHLAVLPKGYPFPEGTPTFHEHLVWIPALADFRMNDGTRYSDKEGVTVPYLTEFVNNI